MYINEYGAACDTPESISKLQREYETAVNAELDKIGDMVQVRGLAHDMYHMNGAFSEYILRRAVKIRKEKRNG